MVRMRMFLYLLCSCIAVPALAGEQPNAAAPCATPAKLDGPWDERGRGYFIGIKAGSNYPIASARLQSKFHLEVQRYELALHAILVADLPAQTIAALRCEPDVDYISYNAVAHTI
jgi:hypothetical protein